MTTKQKHNFRKRARVKMLKKATSIFTKCYWCSKWIVWFQKIKVDKKIIVGDYGTQIIRFGRFEFEGATVDHLQEITNGGKNNIENLVASCRKCNWERSN
jgi:hypothetical protein